MRAGGTYRTPEETREVFWSRVSKDTVEHPTLGFCWVWTHTKFNDGYGRFKQSGLDDKAHRWSYRWAHGDPPKGLHLDHLCRNRACVNPEHLEPVTPRENVLRGEGPAAVNAKKTCCKRGHEFTVANTDVLGVNRRGCKTCRRAQGRKYQKALRARRKENGRS